MPINGAIPLRRASTNPSGDRRHIPMAARIKKRGPKRKAMQVVRDVAIAFLAVKINRTALLISRHEIKNGFRSVPALDADSHPTVYLLTHKISG